MRLTSPEEACAVMAAHVLGGSTDSQVLGTVTLRKHQCEAVRRLRDILARHGGALLADEVGLGKTFVALALAADMEQPVVVAPAALRTMWRGASERTGVKLRFVSMERLGRGNTVPPAGVIIVDEAHHFRNDGTQRYARLADACARSSVLLLSATPVQNSLDDLRRLMALAIGRRAFALDRAELGRLIVRRDAATVTGSTELPRVADPLTIAIRSDADCLNQICALPPPLPPADGEAAQALIAFSLAKQWSSSRAALMAALTRRMAMARAMDDALSCGRRLTRADLALWRFAENQQQLAFPEFASASAAGRGELLEQVRAHHDGVRALMAWIKGQPDIDRHRADELLAIARRHPGERIVAFAHFAETVSALYRLLVQDTRVAALTHGGGRVAGGVVGRGEILAQFGPGARIPDHARIELLLTTDVLSEGVDMQGASVVVHLDLPWNPARMEQRVGRLRRPGATRETIAVYIFAPPAPAERLLQLERRLREKLGEAARSVGVSGAILPNLTPSPGSAITAREHNIATLDTWLRPWAKRDAAIAAAVRSQRDGAIACVRCAGQILLVAVEPNDIEVDPAPDLIRSIAGSRAAECSAGQIEATRQRLTAWMSRRVATEVVQLPMSGTARARRTILRRVNAIAGRTRRHERNSLSAVIGAARRAATVTMPAGAERVLNELAGAALPDEAWLRAIGQFGEIHGRAADSPPDEILVLLLLVAGE